MQVSRMRLNNYIPTRVGRRNRSPRRQRDESIKKKRYAGKEEHPNMYTPSGPPFNIEGHHAEQLRNFGDGYSHHHGNYPQHPHSRSEFPKIPQTLNLPHFHQNYQSHQTFQHGSNSWQYRPSEQGFNWNYDQPVHYNRGHSPRYKRNADFIYHPRYYIHSGSPDRRALRPLKREGKRWLSPKHQSRDEEYSDVTSKGELLTKNQCNDSLSASLNQECQIKETLKDCFSREEAAQLELSRQTVFEQKNARTISVKHCRSHSQGRRSDKMKIVHPSNDADDRLLPAKATQSALVQLNSLHNEDNTILLQEESTHFEPVKLICIEQKFTEPVISNTCTVPPRCDSHSVVSAITSYKYVKGEEIGSPVIGNDITFGSELPVVSSKSESTQQVLLVVTALLESAQQILDVQNCTKVEKSNAHVDIDHGTTPPVKRNRTHNRTSADKSIGNKISSSRNSVDTAVVKNERSQLEVAEKIDLPKCTEIVNTNTTVDTGTGNVTTPQVKPRSHRRTSAETNKYVGNKISSSRSSGDTVLEEDERSQLEVAKETTIVQKCAKIVNANTVVDSGLVTTPPVKRRRSHCPTSIETNKSGGNKIISLRRSGDTAEVEDERSQLEMVQETTNLQECTKIVKSNTNVDTVGVTTPPVKHHRSHRTDADSNKSGGKKITSSRSSGDARVVEDEKSQLEVAQETTLLKQCTVNTNITLETSTGNVTTPPGKRNRIHCGTDADTKFSGKKTSSSQRSGDTRVVEHERSQLEVAQETTIVQKCAKIVKSNTNVNTSTVTTSPVKRRRSHCSTDADTNNSSGKKISSSRNNGDTTVLEEGTAQLKVAQETTVTQKCAKPVKSNTNDNTGDVTTPPVKRLKSHRRTSAESNKSGEKKISSSRSSGDTALVEDKRSQLEVVKETTIVQKCAEIVNANTNVDSGTVTTPSVKHHRSYCRTNTETNKSGGKKISSSRRSGETVEVEDERSHLKVAQEKTIAQECAKIVKCSSNVDSDIVTTPPKLHRSHCRTSTGSNKFSGTKISSSRSSGDTAVVEHERAQMGLAQQKCTEIVKSNTNVDASTVSTPMKHHKSTSCEGPEITYKTSNGKKLSTRLELEAPKRRRQHASRSSKLDNVTVSGSLQVVRESKKLQQIQIPSELKESVERNKCDSKQKKMEPAISSIDTYKSDVITPVKHHSCQSLKDVERRRKTTKEEEINSVLNIDEVDCTELIQSESSRQPIESPLSIEDLSLPPIITQLETDQQAHQRKDDSRLSEVVSNCKKFGHLTEKNKSNKVSVDEKCYTKRQDVIANSVAATSPSVEPSSSKNQHKTRRRSKEKSMNVEEKYEDQEENLKKRKHDHPSYSKPKENESRKPHKKNTEHDLDTDPWEKSIEQKNHESADRELTHPPQDDKTVLDRVTSHNPGPNLPVSNDVVDSSSVFMSYDDWVEQGMPCTKKMKEETQLKILCNKPNATKRLSLALFGNSGKLRRKIVDSAIDTQSVEQCLEYVDDSVSNTPLHKAHTKSLSNETIHTSNPTPELNVTSNVIHNNIPFELSRKEISESAQTTWKDPVNQLTICELTEKYVEYNPCTSAENIPVTSISVDTFATKRRRSNSFSKYQAEKTCVILSMIDTQVPNSNSSSAQVHAVDMVNKLLYSESILGCAEDGSKLTPDGSQEEIVGILTSDLPEVWPNVEVDMKSAHLQSSHSAPSAIVPHDSMISDFVQVSDEHISLLDGLLIDSTMLPKVPKTETVPLDFIDLTAENDDEEHNSFKERFRYQAAKTENIYKRDALLELLEHIITANDVVLKYNHTCSLVSKKVVSQMSRNATIQQEKENLKIEISKIKKHVDFHTTLVQAMLLPGEDLLALLLDSRDSLREAQRMKSKKLTLDSIKYIYDLCSELPCNTIIRPDQFDEINSTERILVTYLPQYNQSSSDNNEELIKRNILHFKSVDQNQNVYQPGMLGHEVSHVNMPPLTAIDHVKSIGTNFINHPQAPPTKQRGCVQDRPSVICVNLDKFVQ